MSALGCTKREISNKGSESHSEGIFTPGQPLRLDAETPWARCTGAGDTIWADTATGGWCGAAGVVRIAEVAVLATNAACFEATTSLGEKDESWSNKTNQTSDEKFLYWSHLPRFYVAPYARHTSPCSPSLLGCGKQRGDRLQSNFSCVANAATRVRITNQTWLDWQWWYGIIHRCLLSKLRWFANKKEFTSRDITWHCKFKQIGKTNQTRKIWRKSPKIISWFLTIWIQIVGSECGFEPSQKGMHFCILSKII